MNLNFTSEISLNENFHKNLTSSYSKGMRQKVGIAIAYAKSKSIFIR